MILSVSCLGTRSAVLTASRTAQKEKGLFLASFPLYCKVQGAKSYRRLWTRDWTERLKQIEIIPDKPYLGWLEISVIKTTFVMDIVLKSLYNLRKDLHSYIL